MSEEKSFDLTKVHEVNLKLLKEIDRICRKYKIKYALDSGTLLGAVRHGGFIPWDDDVDIIVPINEIDFFVDIMRKELPDKYIVYSKEDNPYNRILFPRICMRNNNPLVAYIDVFPMVGLPDDSAKQIKFSKHSDRMNMLYSFKYRETLPVGLKEETNQYEYRKFAFSDEIVEEAKQTVFQVQGKNIIFY